jgi:hypothetical protein
MRTTLITHIEVTHEVVVDTRPDPAIHSHPVSDVALLRLVLARELETINEYERYAQQAESDEMKAFFRHLAKEEKEHVSEAMALINSLDAEQAAEWSEVNITTDHFVNGKAAPPSAAEPAPETKPTPPPSPSWTVGSLKRSD